MSNVVTGQLLVNSLCSGRQIMKQANNGHYDEGIDTLKPNYCGRYGYVCGFVCI